MTYLLLKLLHVASVVVFLGNILTGLFWAARARQTGDFSAIASTFEGIIRSARIFTMPGVYGILVSGFAAAFVAGWPILRTGWILWPSLLFAISGIAFGMRVAPLQRRLVTLARTSERTDESWRQFETLYQSWELWGLVAISTPAAALVIMVLKPALPGL